MFVVKRGFRNLGVVLTAGSVIKDPAVIKHFKSRMAAGDIIVVDEHNYESYKHYFKVKRGVDLQPLDMPEAPKVEAPKVEAPKVEAPKVDKPKAAVAKATTK